MSQKYIPESLLVNLIHRVVEDLNSLQQQETYGLDVQIRIYDLYDRLLQLKEDGHPLTAFVGVPEAARNYLSAYTAVKGDCERAYREDSLRQQLQEQLRARQEDLLAAVRRANEAEELHELAKATLAVWETAGWWQRRKALRQLRQRAGFPLEKKRIGNYVAQTYDLMNDARQAYARQQQAYILADCSFKIRPDLYEKVADIFHSLR